MGYIGLLESLIGMVGRMVALINKLKDEARAAGVTDEQLLAMDVRLTAAIAGREADQG
jgi:hypothetical protein